jgi:hypothetical protein
MDPQRWAQVINKARETELAIRKVNIDVARAPLPAAINTRILYDLYDRVETLEQSLGVHHRSEACPVCGDTYDYRMEAGQLLGCIPEHCSLGEGRRAPRTMDEEAVKDKEQARARERAEA